MLCACSCSSRCVGVFPIWPLTSVQAPPELSIQWEDGAIQGVSRWLSRLWRMVHTHIGAVRGGVASDDQHRDKIVSATHKTIKQVSPPHTVWCVPAPSPVCVICVQVTGAMEGRYTLNTALPELMILSNVLRDHTSSCHTLPYHEALSTLVLLLSPMAPHVSAELWEGLSIARTAYTQAPTIKVHILYYYNVLRASNICELWSIRNNKNHKT